LTLQDYISVKGHSNKVDGPNNNTVGESVLMCDGNPIPALLLGLLNTTRKDALNYDREVRCLFNRNGSKWVGNTPQGTPHGNRIRTPYSSVACVWWTLKWETAKPAQPAMVCWYGSAMAAHWNHACTAWFWLQHRPGLNWQKEHIERRKTLNRSRKRSPYYVNYTHEELLQCICSHSYAIWPLSRLVSQEHSWWLYHLGCKEHLWQSHCWHVLNWTTKTTA
jgi:hypothetical protein